MAPRESQDVHIPEDSSDASVELVTKTPVSAEIGPYAQMAPRCSSIYTLENPEIVVVGAGTAGASMAIALARQGRKVLLLEKSLVIADRIVGELLQPGGIRALESLGLLECATKGCDSVRVDGYTIILPPKVSKLHPEGASILLSYPDHDPSTGFQKFGAGVESTKAGIETGAEAPRGRSFHNAAFVERLRQVARAEPNIRFVEGTVTQLLEEDERVVGVRYKPACAVSESTEKKENTVIPVEVRAPLTVVADGIWSGFRKIANTAAPVHISSFVGVIVTHPPMEAPVPHRRCGHVVLAQPSPILIYQISPTETRVLVDVAGKMPSAADGSLAAFLLKQARFLPECFRPNFVKAVEQGGIKSMPNRALRSSSTMKPGALLIGDALNMRHPLTGGGMTVALKDVALMAEVLGGVDTSNEIEMTEALSSFHQRRPSHAATINVLANALYAVFTAVDGENVDTRRNLQDACFEYLSLGGMYSAGPIGLLSGLTPSPSILATHFFMVALYGVRKHLLTSFGVINPNAWLRVYRLILVACGIIMPLLEIERSTILSWWPVRKSVQLVFPWEHKRWVD